MSILSRLLPKRQPAYPPREAWVVCLDRDRREVTTRVPIVLHGPPSQLTTTDGLYFRTLEACILHYVRVIDTDGTATDLPITGAIE